MAASPFRRTVTGLTVVVRVTPGAGVDRVEGVEVRADGEAVLRLRVKAAPDRGKANAAVVALLAEAFGVPKRAVRITSGATARLKRVAVAGAAEELLARLRAEISA